MDVPTNTNLGLGAIFTPLEKVGHIDQDWLNQSALRTLTPGVTSLTYPPPPSSIPPGIINLGPTYRGYIQPRFNIPPGVYGT